MEGWATLAVATTVAVGVLLAGGARLGSAIYSSVEPLPPTARQLQEEDLDAHPLFRHFAQLKGRVAWRQIGQYPTPVHHVKAKTCGGANIEFNVKREDLASAKYGGNKVRTLQHQLASCEAHCARYPGAIFAVIGSFGSNQVVATKVHGADAFHLASESLEALTFMPDNPDLDNTLNLLSSFSFGGPVILTPLAGLRALFSRLWRPGDKVLPPGGHNVCGVLGQIGACLELAEQIERGETVDPEAIYLPYGSGCTTVGLVMGVAYARHLGLKAFCSPTFKIVAVVVHQAIGFLHNKLEALFWNRMPLSVAWSINEVSAYVTSMGLPSTLRELCHLTRAQCLEIVTAPEYLTLANTG